MKIKIFAIVVVSTLLAGCSFNKPYPNDLEKNLTITLHLEKNGGLLTSARAVVGINDYAKDCSTDYRGNVRLKEGANEIGLAVGQPTYVIVEVSHKTMGNSSSVQRGTALIPKAGTRYQIDANYVDGMYDFRLYEIGRNGKKALGIDMTIPGCRG